MPERGLGQRWIFTHREFLVWLKSVLPHGQTVKTPLFGAICPYSTRARQDAPDYKRPQHRRRLRLGDQFLHRGHPDERSTAVSHRDIVAQWPRADRGRRERNKRHKLSG
jgi:hypothetical protein